MGKEEDPLPRGAARIPLWWMEITPHNVLDLEEDEQRRQAEYDEAVMYARLAAQDDYQQQYGGDGFPGYDPAKHGARGGGGGGGGGGYGGYKRGPNGEWLDKDGNPVFKRGKNGEWIDSQGKLLYKKGPKGEWVDAEGKPLGRNFKPGQSPPGYEAGGYYDPDRFVPGKRASASGLSTGNYQRDANIGWSKPSWTQIKLRSTGTGGDIRDGKYELPKAGLKNKNLAKGGEPQAEAPAPVAANEEAAPTEGEESVTTGTDASSEKEGGIGKLVKRIRRKKVRKSVAKTVKRPSTKPAVAPIPPNESAWAKARREKAEAASPTPAAGAADEEEEIVEEEYEDEVIEDEEYEEEYEEEFVEEEIILEDEDGNEIVTDPGLDGASTHNVTELQAVLAKKANVMKLL
jgi:hypothetical protein